MYREGRGYYYSSVEDALNRVKAGGWVDIASALDIRFIVGRWGGHGDDFYSVTNEELNTLMHMWKCGRGRTE